MNEQELMDLRSRGLITGWGFVNGQLHGVILPNGTRLEGEANVEAKFTKELKEIRDAI